MISKFDVNITGCVNGVVVRERRIRIESQRVRSIIDGNLAILDHHMVTGQTDNAFDKLFVLSLAEGAESGLVKDDNIAALWHVIVASDAGPCSRHFPDDQVVVVMQSFLHAWTVNLV